MFFLCNYKLGYTLSKLTDSYYMQDFSNKMFILLYFKKKVGLIFLDLLFQTHGFLVCVYVLSCSNVFSAIFVLSSPFANVGKAWLEERQNRLASAEALSVQASVSSRETLGTVFIAFPIRGYGFLNSGSREG